MLDMSAPLIELPPLTDPAAWESPLLFTELETPEIVADYLPDTLRDFAKALACATETPEALSVMTVLGTISTISAKHVFINPKPGWHEPINIYTLIALPPANHKSVVLKQCLKPLIDWEQQQISEQEPAIKKKISERKTQEKIIDNLRIKAAKTNDSFEQKQLIQEITALETTLPSIPMLPTLFTNDATPESLANLISEQQGRLAIISDEGGIVETLAGLYSNGSANIDILLKGIDGGEVRIRRKDRAIRLNPYLTVLLAVQPAIIQNMSEKRLYTGSGVLERFLYVLPKSQLGYRTHNTPAVAESVQASYHNKITNLLNSFANAHKISVSHTLTLSAKAYQLWREFQATIEKELRPEGNLANCPGWGGKICGFSLRIAGLLHVAEFETGNLTINESTMRNALTIAELLTQHAAAAFNLMGVDAAVEDAKVILQWIQSQAHKTFRQTELVLAMRNRKLGKPERLSKALHVLYQRNIISSPIKIATTKKPTTVYQVNPRLFFNS
ncbi:MAG TPA: YfjI family protein [Gammaproteobacteria bacterium]|nr:YfjI family protein [Gammaproteobacteria bacterium]